MIKTHYTNIHENTFIKKDEDKNFFLTKHMAMHAKVKHTNAIMVIDIYKKTQSFRKYFKLQKVLVTYKQAAFINTVKLSK